MFSLQLCRRNVIYSTIVNDRLPVYTTDDSDKIMSVTRLKPARRGRHKGTEIDVKVKPNRLTEIFPGFLLSSFTWILSHYFVQPLFGPNEYYIDEEFHVPQVRHYCLAEFHKVCKIQCLFDTLDFSFHISGSKSSYVMHIDISSCVERHCSVFEPSVWCLQK